MQPLQEWGNYYGEVICSGCAAGDLPLVFISARKLFRIVEDDIHDKPAAIEAVSLPACLCVSWNLCPRTATMLLLFMALRTAYCDGAVDKQDTCTTCAREWRN